MEHEEKQITALIEEYAEKVQAVNEAGREINKILENLKNRIATKDAAENAVMAVDSKMDIYRDGYFGPQEQEKIEAIENALGYKLFFWQKLYIFTGKFGCFGATTAEILKTLTDEDQGPLDYSIPARSNREKIFRDELKKIQYRLAASGIKTRTVFWNTADKWKYYDQTQELKGKRNESGTNRR